MSMVWNNINFHADVLLDDFLVAENTVSQSDDNSLPLASERASSLTDPRINLSLTMPSATPVTDGRHEKTLPGGVR